LADTADTDLRRPDQMTPLNPNTSSAWSSAWARWSPRRSPAMRSPSRVRIGWCTAVSPSRVRIGWCTAVKVVGKVGAELQKKRTELGVHRIHVKVVDHACGLHDPRIGVTVGVAASLGAKQRGLLLHPPDEQHSSSRSKPTRYWCMTSSLRCPFRSPPTEPADRG
jgi:hypothetical protein